MADYSISFRIPNGQINPRLSGNSSYSRRGKYRLLNDDKAYGLRMTQDSLNTVEPADFLTNCGQHPLEDAFPVTLICRRVYSGKNQPLDDDNIRPAFKGYRDGIVKALGISDAPQFLTGQYPQVRVEKGFYLEFEVIPAWATILEKAS